MKPVANLMLLAASLLSLAVSAQDGFKNGTIITDNGEKLEGSIKPLFKSSGKLVFLSQDNKKTTYSPAALKSFSIEGVRYISYFNDFYEEVAGGEKAKLYRKMTDNSGEVIYNGSQAVGFAKTTDGKRGDYYVIRNNESSFDLITEKNFKDYFTRLASDNDSLSSKIKNGSLGYAQIKTVMEQIQ
jgi:hypothetical protein